MILKANEDFQRVFNVDPQLGDHFLVKSLLATGWAKFGRVVRTTKTQIELSIIDIIPTEDTSKLVNINGADLPEGFLEDRKTALIGKKEKFFKKSGVEVGASNHWCPDVLCEIFEKAKSKYS